MSKKEIQFVEDKLTEFSDQFTEPRNYSEFGLVLRDENEKVAGGITGSTVWDWLHISVLWVSDELRGKGYGTELLLAGERLGKERGCGSARLHTFEFQAREFYESHGYKIANQTANFPKEHVQFLMTKKL